MKTDTRMLPCPFCGGAAVYCFNATAARAPMHWYLCRDCHASPGDRPTETEAIAAWNRRVTATPPVDGDGYPDPDSAEVRQVINETIFKDRPDLQFKFDGSAPPLIEPPVDGEAKMREALRPFAEAARFLEDRERDEAPAWDSSVGDGVYVRDFRQALKAYDAASTQTGGGE